MRYRDKAYYFQPTLWRDNDAGLISQKLPIRIQCINRCLTQNHRCSPIVELCSSKMLGSVPLRIPYYWAKRKQTFIPQIYLPTTFISCHCFQPILVLSMVEHGPSQWEKFPWIFPCAPLQKSIDRARWIVKKLTFHCIPCHWNGAGCCSIVEFVLRKRQDFYLNAIWYNYIHVINTIEFFKVVIHCDKGISSHPHVELFHTIKAFKFLPITDC